MIDLTPLDVRSKRGDFRRILRGYEPQEVDTFLELVAERLPAHLPPDWPAIGLAREAAANRHLQSPRPGRDR